MVLGFDFDVSTLWSRRERRHLLVSLQDGVEDLVSSIKHRTMLIDGRGLDFGRGGVGRRSVRVWGERDVLDLRNGDGRIIGLILGNVILSILHLGRPI